LSHGIVAGIGIGTHFQLSVSILFGVTIVPYMKI